MAKQVEDIVVRLVGEGFEALDKIKGSFRELGKVTNLAEKDILSARDSLLDYARKAGNTEAVNKGLIDAFKGLRSQVDLSSEAYRSLSGELRRLDEESKGATRSVMAQRDAVLSSTAAGTQNVAALQQQRAALIALRTQTRDASTAFNQFSTDIQAVEARLTNLADVNNRLNSALSRARAGTAAGARAELEVIERGISLRRQEINDIDLLNKKQRNTPEILRQRLELENQLNASLAARRQIQFQETARTGRENVRTGAATFNSADLTGTGYLTARRIAGRLGDLPDTTAGLSQELGELNERLINTYRNTETYIAVQLRLAAVQRDVTSATQGFGAALLADLNAGTLIPSQKNLAEVIGQLRREMLELDTTTTAGAQAYANNARQADQLDRQLRELAGAYRQVGSMATVAATAEQNAANARIRGNYLNRGAVRQQEQALRELGGRVQQGVAGTPLLLPAAGQTSAPGTGQAISGANVTTGTRASRTLREPKTVRMIGYGSEQPSGVERFFSSTEPGRFASSRPIGPTATPSQAAQNRSEQIAQRDGLKATADAARATEQQMHRLRAAVDIATKANTGSVTSLGRLREALVNLRNEIPGTNKEFQQLNQQVEGVDRRANRLQTSRRPSTGQLVQAGGAAISGGIFGGPEGFLGGVGGAVLGTALPGIGTAGGAFAGAAIGAQAGMFRQQLGGTADYAASIGKLQIALRGVVGSQEAYDAAIRAAAAATRDLNIPQEEATRGLTRLSAAVIGAGGTVADSSFAFRAMSEAIKATGGNAEQVDGALLALTQVFSKGKVSAEELNQIAERLPGTFTLFAQAAGKTGPELQKALEQGQVGLNDLMKFLDLTSKRYGTTALEIAGSSQDAGARLTVAFQAMRLEVGKALQPLGAELQGAFAAFIKDITPAVVGSAKAIAAVLSFFTTNEVAGGLARFALQAGAVALAIKGLQAASARLVALNIASWFTGAASGATQLQLPIAGATTKVGIFKAAVTGLGTALKALLPLTLITITVDVIVKGIAKLIAAREELKKLRNERNSVPGEGEGIGPKLVLNAERRYTGASREKIIRDQQEQQKFVAGLRKQLQDLEATQSGLGTAYGQTAIGGVANIGRGFEQENTKAAIELLKEKIKRSEEVLNLNVQTFRTEAEIEKARQAALNNKFADPTGGEDTKDKAADKARKDAEAAAAEQQRYLESFMQQQIRVADTVFQHQKDLDRQRFDLLKELTDIEAQNRINKLFGPEREAANIQERRRQRTLEYENRILTAMNAVAAAQQKFSSAQQMATVTAASAAGVGAGMTGIYRQGSIGPTSTGPHFDVKRADGGFFTRGALDQFVQVNGRPLSSGVTVPGGEFNARRPGRARHGGYDYAFAPGAGLSLTGGAEFVSSRKTAHGDETAFRTPDGSVYKLLHGRFEQGGKLPTGVAAQQRRNVADTGDVALAGLDVTQAKAALANLTAERDRFNAAFGDEQINALTASLTTQNYEIEKTIALETKRFDLVLKGYSAERIALEQKFDQARIERDAALTGVAPGDETQVLAINTAYERQIVLLQDLYDAQTQFNNSFGAGFQTGVQQYVQSLGTMNQAAAQLTQTGLKGIEDTLFSLVTTGTANFREFAAEILKQSARMILQLTIQRVIMQILGAIGGGGAPVSPSAPGGDWMGAVGRMNPTSDYAMGGAFAKNNIVPYATGGVVSRPTLFKFAQGGTMRTGLMGEAGPEAIMPLSRGPNGKLGVASSGSGTTNVVVNVDASGNSQVAGDQAQGAQLGRVISQAVQAELIKQKRPGGLLAA